MKPLRNLLFTLLLFITLISNTAPLTVHAKKITYYSKLTSSQKKMYRKIRDALNKTSKISNIKTTVNGSYKDMLRSVEALGADYPYYFPGSLEIKYYYDKNKTHITINSINSKKTIKNIKKIALKADLAGKDNLATILNIHNYLIDNVEYDFDNSPNNIQKFSIAGAMLNKKAVCEGYARTFKYLCDLYEIPCILATGIGVDEFNPETVRHMWNYVYLDHEWYAVDVTWNDINTFDSSLKYSYFLVGSNSLGNNNKLFKESHIRDKMFFNFDIKDVKGFSYPTISEISYFNEQLPYSYLIENGYLTEETHHQQDVYDNSLKPAFIH